MSNSKREKKFLIIGGICLSLTGLFMLVIKPIYAKHIENQDKIDKKERLLHRYKAILKQEDEINERMKYIKNDLANLNNMLLSGAKPSLAASELQGIIEKIANKRRVEIKNVRNKKPKRMKELNQIPLEVTFESTLRELADVIYNIETSDKFLFVKDLNIQLKKSDNPEKLETKLTLNGFIVNNANL